MIKKYNQYIKEELNFRNLFKKRIKNYPKIDSNDIDPYGEEIWDDDLTPVLKIARKQGLPYGQITRLNCSIDSLTSLEGIENLTKLESLECSFNKLYNLKGIENLIGLKKLSCHHNNLINLDEIKSLINLEYVNCWNNDFSEEYHQYLIEYCENKKIQLVL